jgi:glycosyltransferase involved in cell wall biosynthesis
LVISLAPGGLERLVVDWTNARNRRHAGSTGIVCLDEPGALAGQVEGQEAVACLEAQRAEWPWDRAAVRRLIQLLSPAVFNRLPQVILHAHNLAAWQYAVLAKHHRRLIYTQHGANIHNLGLVDRVRARILACFTDGIVAVSEATAKEMARTLWLPRRRISVVVNGVSVWGAATTPSPFRGEGRGEGHNLRRKLNIPIDAVVIGSVGRLAQVKVHDRLIRMFADLTPIPPYSGTPTLLLVGDGPERSNLEKRARELGVSERVLFAGYQADPKPYLAAMNLFVLPSRSEGLSISLLEAMSAGIPVAVTDVGANGEVVDQGRAGTILSDHESEWPDQIKSVLSDPNRLQAMSRMARERVERDYSMDATLAGYEALYQPVPLP